MKDNISPKVSVIIPCYNQTTFLKETVESVINQSYTNWECIIVNDGSTDNSQEIIDGLCKIDNRIKCHIQQNRGLSASRNIGLDLSCGEYIQFLDADDIILPTKLEKQIEQLEINPNLDISICRFRYFIGAQDNQYDNSFNLHEYDFSLNSFLYKWAVEFSFPPVCYFVKKDFLTKNEIRFNEDLRACEDWYFLVEASMQGGRLCEYPEKLALYRMHHNNMSSNPSKMVPAIIQLGLSVQMMLSGQIKEEYSVKFPNIAYKLIQNHYRVSQNAKKANSLDYKIGYVLMYLPHRVKRFVKKIIK